MDKKEEILKLLSWKKGKAYIAEKVGITKEALEELLKLYKEKEEGFSESYDLSKGERKINSDWSYAPTTEEIIKRHNIDTSKWQLLQFWSKESGNGYKVSANFKQISKKESDLDKFAEYLSIYKSPHIPKEESVRMVELTKPANECSALIDLTDFHLDKKGLLGETVEERINMFNEILKTLTRRAHISHNLTEIVFVIGSDMLHTDTFFNTTTNGTPQDVIVDGYNAYELAFDLYVNAIKFLENYCDKLKVMLIQGNHGRTREFYLAHSLSKYFEPSQNIEFDISPEPRKIHIYGNTFKGFHHGNCKIDELPLVFAKQFAPQWGRCKFHEIVVGDKHYYYEKEIKGVRIKQLPALADTDRWHDDNNYVENIRAGICTVYDKVKGKISEFEERYSK